MEGVSLDVTTKQAVMETSTLHGGWREPHSRDNHVPYPPQPLPRRTRRVDAPNPGCVGPVAGAVVVEV